MKGDYKMSRRSNLEGCIVKDPRGNGRYIARIQIGYNANGNPRIKSFSGKSVAEVKRRLKEFKHELDNNVTIDQANGILSESMYAWLEKYKKPFVKPLTYDRLIQTIEANIIPYIGQYPIRSITSGDIQSEVINRMLKRGLSLSSIRKAYQILNGLFRQYFIERKIPCNPLDGVIMPTKHQFEKKVIKPLSIEEMERFERTATSKWGNPSVYRYRYGFGLVLVLYTGLREGEALALQYKHIDLKNKKITVEQNLIMATDGSGDKHRTPIVQPTTKTASGIREVPLCDKALEAVKNHMELYYHGNDEEYVFCTKNNTHLQPHTITKSVNRIFSAAGINASGMHILRHSFASYLYAQGIDIKYISQILGHSGTQITYDTYVHTDFTQLQNVINMIN